MVAFGVLQSVLFRIGIEVRPRRFKVRTIALSVLMDMDGVAPRRQAIQVEFEPHLPARLGTRPPLSTSVILCLHSCLGRLSFRPGSWRRSKARERKPALTMRQRKSLGCFMAYYYNQGMSRPPLHQQNLLSFVVRRPQTTEDTEGTGETRSDFLHFLLKLLCNPLRIAF